MKITRDLVLSHCEEPANETLQRLYKFAARHCLIFLHSSAWLLTFMGQSVRVVRSRGCWTCDWVRRDRLLCVLEAAGHVTGLGETGCCGLGMTKSVETVYGGINI